jgi:hypothetical protein
MEKYRNLNGDSGVNGFQLLNDGIIVQFNDGKSYLYNTSKPGTASVQRMIGLAQSGKGLNSYISRFVRKNYAARL